MEARHTSAPTLSSANTARSPRGAPWDALLEVLEGRTTGSPGGAPSDVMRLGSTLHAVCPLDALARHPLEARCAPAGSTPCATGATPGRQVRNSSACVQLMSGYSWSWRAGGGHGGSGQGWGGAQWVLRQSDNKHKGCAGGACTRASQGGWRRQSAAGHRPRGSQSSKQSTRASHALALVGDERESALPV